MCDHSGRLGRVVRDLHSSIYSGDIAHGSDSQRPRRSMALSGEGAISHRIHDAVGLRRRAATSLSLGLAHFPEDFDLDDVTSGYPLSTGSVEIAEVLKMTDRATV